MYIYNTIGISRYANKCKAQLLRKLWITHPSCHPSRELKDAKKGPDSGSLFNQKTASKLSASIHFTFFSKVKDFLKIWDVWRPVPSTPLAELPTIISRFGRDKSLNLTDSLCHGKLVIFQLVSPDIPRHHRVYSIWYMYKVGPPNDS